jgi:hypothetical protein
MHSATWRFWPNCKISFRVDFFSQGLHDGFWILEPSHNSAHFSYTWFLCSYFPFWFLSADWNLFFRSLIFHPSSFLTLTLRFPLFFVVYSFLIFALFLVSFSWLSFICFFSFFFAFLSLQIFSTFISFFLSSCAFSYFFFLYDFTYLGMFLSVSGSPKTTVKLVQGGTWIRRKLAQCEQFL